VSVCPSVCLSVRPCDCLSVRVSVPPCVCLSVPCVCPSVCLSVRPCVSVRPYACLSVHPCVCLSVPCVCPCVCLSVRVSVCPSVCLSVRPVCLSVCLSVRVSVCPSVSHKSCTQNQNTHFVFSNFCFTSCRLWHTVEQLCEAGQATDGNMTHALCMLHNPRAGANIRISG
jgi:hypothetical protein